MRYCFVSLDVEEDFRDGQSVSEFYGVQMLPALQDIFNKHRVQTTFFCTGETIGRHPGTLRTFKDAGHEMALHGFFSHINMLEQASDERERLLRKHVELYTRTFGEAPKGFRAVQNTIDQSGMALLEKEGFWYDSSLLSRCPVGKRYVGYAGRAPRKVYRPSVKNIRNPGDMHIVEIPLAPLVGGVQLQGRWIQKLGTPIMKQLLRVHAPSLLSFSFHSWDLLSGAGASSVRRDSFLRQIDELLDFLQKKQYRFLRGDELYALISKDTA